MTDAADRLYEQVLVLRCQAGDDGAFAEIVQRYHGRLRYFVRRLLDRPDDADDVLQDVWLRAYRKLWQLNDGRALSVWLYRIARNAALAELRRRYPECELDVESAAAERDGWTTSGLSPDEAARVHAALGRVRPEHREVLVLRFLENMSYEDIAAVAGCPIGTVRSRIHYAKLELRRQMGE